MAPSLLELKLISCKDVKASFNFFKKLCISATVYILNQPPNDKKKATVRYQQQKTQVDKEGDGYAYWNHHMSFDLRNISSFNLDNLFLEFDLKCEGIVYGNNTVGQVRVPIKELVVQDCRGSVCYQVMSSDGKHNGVLDFSYKLIDLDGDKVPENLYQATLVPENRYQPTPSIYPLPEVLHHVTPSIDLLPENRYQPTPSIYPSLESIESNYVPLVMPEVHEREISPESIYPSVDTVPVLPEKPHVYFQPPVEVNYYYSPPPSSFVHPPISNNSYGTGLAGYDYNAGYLYPIINPY
ncbi:hypothetical protein ACHQM5_025959 [Ranunculus cassubicifolius]